MPRPGLPATIRGEFGNFLLFQAVPRLSFSGLTLFQLPQSHRKKPERCFNPVFKRVWGNKKGVFLSEDPSFNKSA